MPISRNSKAGRALRGKSSSRVMKKDFSDPRVHIAAALDALSKAGMHNESGEFMEKLNRVSGPDEAMQLARQYRNLSQKQFKE